MLAQANPSEDDAGACVDQATVDEAEAAASCTNLWALATAAVASPRSVRNTSYAALAATARTELLRSWERYDAASNIVLTPRVVHPRRVALTQVCRRYGALERRVGRRWTSRRSGLAERRLGTLARRVRDAVRHLRPVERCTLRVGVGGGPISRARKQRELKRIAPMCAASLRNAALLGQ